MGSLEDLKIAALSPDDLETIQQLEEKLGPDIRLVAVEAKTAPKVWERVDRVYPEIKDIKAYYTDLAHASESKGMLKYGSSTICVLGF